MTPENIIHSVVAFYKIPFDSMMLKNKKSKKYLRPMAIAVYLVKTKFKMTYKELLNVFNISEETLRMYYISIDRNYSNKDYQTLEDIDSILKICKYSHLSDFEKIGLMCELFAGEYLSYPKISAETGINECRFSYAITTHWFGKRKFTENSKYIPLKSKV